MKTLSVLLAIAGSALLLLSSRPGQPITPGGAADRPVSPERGGSQAEERPAEAGAAIASSSDTVSYGRALFQAKGCTACHHHGEVNPGAGVGVGPDLTRAVFRPDYLRAWLSDPAAIRPGTLMPNLALAEREIEALIAFINDKGE